jgi:DNA adenine methylase Dam
MTKNKSLQRALKNDLELRTLRKQLGEQLWNDRVEVARERQRRLQEVQAQITQGVSRTRALREYKLGSDTFGRWSQRYAKQGLAGLIDRPRQRVDRSSPAVRRSNRKRRPAVGFVKWAGSKLGVVEHLLGNAPSEYRTYYEPMVGAGILFAKLAPDRAILGDVNDDLMTCYRVIQEQVGALCEVLARHRNTYEHYVKVRALNTSEILPVEVAARFIYLNKTCYNGLYRVNRFGHFNVPYGRRPDANFCDFDTLRTWHSRLQGVKLRTGNYRRTTARARDGDFVYLDPPYLSRKKQCRYYHRYNQQVFDLEAHKELAVFFGELDRRGCHVLLSNSNHPTVRELYAGYEMLTIHTRRPIHRNVDRRDGYTELLISNRPLT